MCTSRTYCNDNWRILYFVISITGTEVKKEMNNSARRKTFLLLIKYGTMSICNALYSAYDSN